MTLASSLQPDEYEKAHEFLIRWKQRVYFMNILLTSTLTGETKDPMFMK